MTLAQPETEGGINGAAVKSVTIGPVSTSYETSSSSGTDGGPYGGTSYGREYHRLIRLYSPRFITA